MRFWSYMPVLKLVLRWVGVILLSHTAENTDAHFTQIIFLTHWIIQ